MSEPWSAWNTVQADPYTIRDGQETIAPQPDFVGKWSFSKDFGVSFMSTTYPNFLYRFMQRWVLGIHWRRR